MAWTMPRVRSPTEVIRQELFLVVFDQIGFLVIHYLTSANFWNDKMNSSSIFIVHWVAIIFYQKLTANWNNSDILSTEIFVRNGGLSSESTNNLTFFQENLTFLVNSYVRRIKSLQDPRKVTKIRTKESREMLFDASQ